METPDSGWSSQSLRRLGTYLGSGLGAGKKTKDLAPVVTADTTAVVDTQRGREDTYDVFVGHTARIDVAERTLEDVLQGFADEVFNASERDRDASPYKGIFITSIAALKQPRRDAQAETVGDFLEHLDNFSDEEVVQNGRPKIEEALGELTDELEQHKAAAKAWEKAKVANVLARQAFVSTYVSTYGAVISVLGSKRKAEKYFLRTRKSKRHSEVEAEEEAQSQPEAVAAGLEEAAPEPEAS